MPAPILPPSLPPILPVVKPPDEKSRMNGFADTIKDGFRKVGTFIYETPYTIVALVVIGVALLILFPEFAPPFLGAAGAHTLTRLAVKIINLYYSEKMVNFKEKIYDFDQKYSRVVYIAFLVAVAICYVSPIAGFIVTVGLGIYKGLIAEVEISKFKQRVEKEGAKKIEYNLPPGHVAIASPTP